MNNSIKYDVQKAPKQTKHYKKSSFLPCNTEKTSVLDRILMTMSKSGNLSCCKFFIVAVVTLPNNFVHVLSSLQKEMNVNT